MRDIIEVIYYCAGIALVAGLFLARSQMHAIQRDSRVRNERLAKEKAIEASSMYLTKCVRLSNENIRIRAESGFTFYEGPIDDFSFEKLSQDRKDLLGQKLNQDSSNVKLINSLEIMASYFVSGVADEETGFKICGRSFCHSVSVRYDIICALRGEKNPQRYWHNIVCLFEVWNPRLTRGELAQRADHIAEEMAGLPKDLKIAAIGDPKV